MRLLPLALVAALVLLALPASALPAVCAEPTGGCPPQDSCNWSQTGVVNLSVNLLSNYSCTSGHFLRVEGCEGPLYVFASTTVSATAASAGWCAG